MSAGSITWLYAKEKLLRRSTRKRGVRYDNDESDAIYIFVLVSPSRMRRVKALSFCKGQ